MREIKFRAKEIGFEGKWRVGDLHITATKPHIHSLSNKYLIKIETIGQFTGLYDKNGKEIYEGDIVYSEFEDGSNGSSLVGWNEKQSCFGIMDEYAYQSKLEGFEYPAFQNHVMLAFMRDAKLFEVIGNIYDNPELLNKSNMKKFVVTIFNLRYHSFNKVNITFTNEELVTLDNVYQKVKTKLNTEQFMLISWSPVDEFSI